MQNLALFTKTAQILPHQPVYEPGHPRENPQKTDCQNPHFSSQPALKSLPNRENVDKKPVFVKKEVTLKPFKREKAQKKPANSIKIPIKKQISSPIVFFSQRSQEKAENVKQTSLGNTNSSCNFSEKLEKCCKICFEAAETKATGKLISPCRCTGSVRFIHEECLKTWQISQKIDLKNAECELCHWKYAMDFEYGWKFYPKQAIEDGLLSFISCLCLFILIGTLLSIIAIFALKINSDGDFMKNEKDDSSGTTYKLGILIACCCICFILIILCALSTKEACCILKISKWSIFNYVHEKTGKTCKSPKKSELSRKRTENLAKIYPRSNSDTVHCKATAKSAGKVSVEVKIIRTNLLKIDNNGEFLKVSHQNLIPVQEKRPFQRDLVDFSSGKSEKSGENAGNPRSFGDLHRKTRVFPEKAEKMSKASSGSWEKHVQVQYLQQIPGDFLNNCANNEKTLEVVVNNTKEGGKLNFVETLLFSKKFLSPIARKNFLFKKHVVSLEKNDVSESV